MASVYNEGIEDRMATFETKVRTPQAIAAQLTALIDRYPAVVVRAGCPGRRICLDERRAAPKSVSTASPDASGAERAARAFETLDCVVVERLLGEAAED